MKRSSIFKRVAGGICLALAITISFVVPVAEAHAEAASATAVAHVESPDGKGNCPPAHDHWNCTVCRALRLAARSEPAQCIDTEAGAVALVPEQAAGHSQFAPTASANPRAPPTSAG